MFTIRINDDLSIEVDQFKKDCQGPVHCHISRFGQRVARVWIHPVNIEYGHMLDSSEVVTAFNTVVKYKDDIEKEYLYNQKNGTY